MPNKFNTKCLTSYSQDEFTVRSWAEYDAALRARGSLTWWVTDAAMKYWAALPRSTPGGQYFYSDLAIETSLKLRLVFGQPLRQTEGLMASIFDLLGVCNEGAGPQYCEPARHELEVECQSMQIAAEASTHSDRQHWTEGIWFW